MHPRSPAITLSLLASLTLLPACDSSNKSSGFHELTRDESAAQAIAAFKQADPGLKRFFDNAAGYAVFPAVGKGGFIITAGGGDGVVYAKDGAVIGYASMTTVKVGAAAGGQGFKEIIFFKDPADLTIFKGGNLEFDATASAVVAKSGASASSDYSRGIAVFIIGEQGLMLDASVGGQGFKFFPKR